MMHVLGVKHKIPEILSKYTASWDGPNDTVNDADEEASAFAFTTAHNLQVVTWERVKVATQSAKSMLQLLSIIQNGFPASKQDASQGYSGIPSIYR